MSKTQVLPSYIDFTGASNGQVLSYNGTEVVYITPKTIANDTTWVAKGDLIVGTANDTAVVLSSSAVNNQALVVDTTTATGLKWATLTTAARQETKVVNTSTSTTQAFYETAAFSFVVGQCFIEYLDGTSATAVPLASAWVNLRSYNGTKTANITDRYSGVFGTSSGAACYWKCERNTNGTIVRVNRPFSDSSGADGLICTGGLCSPTNLNWNTSYQLRITAYEDTQS